MPERQPGLPPRSSWAAAAPRGRSRSPSLITRAAFRLIPCAALWTSTCSSPIRLPTAALPAAPRATPSRPSSESPTPSGPSSSSSWRRKACGKRPGSGRTPPAGCPEGHLAGRLRRQAQGCHGGGGARVHPGDRRRLRREVVPPGWGSHGLRPTTREEVGHVRDEGDQHQERRAL